MLLFKQRLKSFFFSASAVQQFNATEHTTKEVIAKFLKYAPDRRGGGGRKKDEWLTEYTIKLWKTNLKFCFIKILTLDLNIGGFGNVTNKIIHHRLEAHQRKSTNGSS